MRIAAMQPYLFPYLGYYQLIQAVDKFILLDDVNFIKRGWVNRNRILVNGKDHLFSLPLQRASQFRKISDMKLADYSGWRNRFLKTLTHAYRKASQYEPVMEMLHQALPQTAGGLNQLLHKSLAVVCEYLGIQTRMESLTAKPRAKELKGAERVLSICRELEAREYVNLPGAGRELYKAEMFGASGVCLRFLKPEAMTYPQFNNHFIPMLSIVDAIMFNEKTQIQSMLDACSMEVPV